MANGSFLFFQCWKVAYLMHNCPETAFFRLSTELARIRGLQGGGGGAGLLGPWTRGTGGGGGGGGGSWLLRLCTLGTVVPGLDNI